MYEKKVGRAYLRGCLRTVVVGAAGLLLGVALLTSVLLLIEGGRVEPRSARLALALAMPALFLSAPLGGALIWVRTRGRRLDRAFAPWRLHGRQTGPVMRSWHGEIDGREFDAWFTRGPTLELYLACSPATRGVIHRGGPLIRALSRAVGSRPPMTAPGLDLEGVSVHADHPDWMRRLLAIPRARRALAALLAETPRAAVAVSLAPNAVRYVRRFLPLAEIDADNLRRWLGWLSELAAAVDAAGPSVAGLQPTSLEEWARTARGRHLNKMLAVLGLVLALVMAALFLFGWLFVGHS